MVREVVGDCAWFKPFMAFLTSQLMTKVRLGVKARVIFGVVKRMLDLTTDVYVRAYFKSEGKKGNFQASLASLTVSMGIQLIFVWISNKGVGMGKVLWESFPILIDLNLQMMPTVRRGSDC